MIVMPHDDEYWIVLEDASKELIKPACSSLGARLRVKPPTCAMR